jgi:nucleotide-binding universal stress UspA family protein
LLDSALLRYFENGRNSLEFLEGWAMTEASLKPNRVHRVLVGVDGSEQSLNAVRQAARLPLAGNATLVLLHVIHRDLGTSVLLNAMAEEDAPKFLAAAADGAALVASATGADIRVEEGHFVHGIPATELARFAARTEAELIIIGQHGRYSLAEALVGSTVEQIVRQSRVGVLIVRSATHDQYRRPLLALDSSDSCRDATRLAIKIAGPLDAFDVVHGIHAGADEFGESEAVLELLQAIAGFDVPWSVVGRSAEPHHAAVEAAAKCGSDLLVLGAHRSALTHRVSSRQLAGVVREARCDVLIGPGAT